MGLGQQMRWPFWWVAVRYCYGNAAADAANSKEGALWCYCGAAATLLRCGFSSFGGVGFVRGHADSWVKGGDRKRRGAGSHPSTSTYVEAT